MSKKKKLCLLAVLLCLIAAGVLCITLRRHSGREYVPGDVKSPISIIVDGRQTELAAGSVEVSQLLTLLRNTVLRRKAEPTEVAVNGKVYQIVIPAGEKSLQWEVIADDTGCDVNISDGAKRVGWHVLSDTKELISLLSACSRAPKTPEATPSGTE